MQLGITEVTLMISLLHFSNIVFTVFPQASSTESFPRITTDFAVTSDDLFLRPSTPVEWAYHSAEEEIWLVAMFI